MKKRWGHSKIWAAVLPMAALCHLSTAARAQVPGPRSVYLYSAALGSAQASINAAKTASWGNGEARNDRFMTYEGAPVLRVTTRNFQEGIRFDLNTPVDFDAYKDKGFLRLRVRFRDNPSAGGGMMGGMPGMGGDMGDRGGGRRGMGGEGFGGMGGGGQFGGMGGGGQFGGGNQGNFEIRPLWTGQAQFGGALPQLGGAPGGMPGGMPGGFDPNDPNGNAAAMVVPQTTPITEFGVTLLRENGASSGRIPINLDTTTPDDAGWRLLVLPLKDLTSSPGASGAITRVVLTSDKEDNFYLAQAAIVIESGQITVSLRRPSDPAGAQVAEIEIKPGPVTLIADVEAGAADPTVEWNFDADNVGNLPPGALSSPATGMGEGGMTEGGVMPGMMPGMIPGGRPNQATPTRPMQTMPGRAVPGMTGAIPGGMGAVGTQVGPRLDARGLTATYEYPNEEQNYRVEVTVRDRSGEKEPVTASILVRVRA